MDLVQDHPCASGGQPWVALHPAAQLALHVGARIIQHNTALRYIELAIRVARDPGRARRLYVDLDHTVGRAQDGRLLLAGRVVIGDDLGLPGVHAQQRRAKCLRQRQRQTLQARATNQRPHQPGRRYGSTRLTGCRAAAFAARHFLHRH